MENREMVYEICAKDSIASHASLLLQNCANLLSNNELVDCTIVCKDGQLQAHKVILASSCKFMESLLTCTSLPTPCSHPMIFLRRWKSEDFKPVLEYMYTGKTSIRQTKLATILKICDELEYLALAKAVMKATSKSRSSSVSSTGTVLPNTQNSLVSEFVSQKNMSANLSYLPKICNTKISRSSSQVQESSPNPSLQNMNTDSFVKNEMESEEDVEEFFNFDDNPLQLSPSVDTVVGNKRQRELEASGDEKASKRRTTEMPDLNVLPFFDAKSEVFEDDNEPEDENNEDVINLVKAEDLFESNLEQDGSGESISQCPWCHETFTGVAVFQRHLRTHVNKCRPYSCEYCQTSFARSAHLKRHLRTHTGEKPYVCSICQRAFARQDKLKGHMERHLQQASRNENLASSSNNNNSNSNDTHTTFSPGKVGRPSKTPSFNLGTLLKGNGATNGNRFEIGTTTSNGLSISLASSTSRFSENKEKSQFPSGGGLTVTPALRPSPAYIQSLSSAGVGTIFANGSKPIKYANYNC